MLTQMTAYFAESRKRLIRAQINCKFKVINKCPARRKFLNIFVPEPKPYPALNDAARVGYGLVCLMAAYFGKTKTVYCRMSTQMTAYFAKQKKIVKSNASADV